MYGQNRFDPYSTTGTASNCKTSPPEKQLSVQRSLTNINALLVPESKSSAVLHGIAMEGRTTAIFQFGSNIHKILECFSPFQTPNKTYSIVSRGFGHFRERKPSLLQIFSLFFFTTLVAMQTGCRFPDEKAFTVTYFNLATGQRVIQRLHSQLKKIKLEVLFFNEMRVKM